MLEIFTKIADLCVYDLFGLVAETKLADSLHFFIEDTTKIFALLLIMIYIISLLRANLDVEAVRRYLIGKNRFLGYLIGAVFGAITPFCSCSSIPLFLGFTTARIPLGITMSFLITSPMINEVAVALLGSLLGIKFTIVYVLVGLLAGIIGGAFLDLIKADRYLQDFIKESIPEVADESTEVVETDVSLELESLSWKERHEFAKKELKEIYGRVWKWVIIGVGAGAALHGYAPEDFISGHLASGELWTVPAAVLLGIPLYANATGVIPIAESLLSKGLPIGTTVAFMMSTVAASFPEFMMLKQVMKVKLLLIFFLMLLVFFTITGWIFNLVWY
jgi:uncharacterized membrane protein YraQ (UPF0718 family)